MKHNYSNKTKKFIILTLCFLCAICQLHAQRKPVIDRSQFKISATSAIFNEEGGSKSFTVTADKEWTIQTKPASWASLTVNGHTLSLKVRANTTTSQRTTFFTITSIGKVITVKITQTAAPTFEVSSTNESFGVHGGTKTLTINSSKTWEIGSNTKSWLHLSKNGSSLNIRVDANSQTSSRKTSFTISSGEKSINVFVSQSGAAVKFNISATSVNFGANGGTKTLTVTSNNKWKIYTNTASWGHLSRSGNTLTLSVDANSNSSSRSDYFIIKSGSKTVRVDISQSARNLASSSTSNATSQKFGISTNTVSFNANGGSHTFSVTSNKDWSISTNTASWGHLTKNGNILTLKVSKNSKPEARTDYFIIKSGEKSIRVNISQSADIESLIVNGSSLDVSLNYSSYGGTKDISVNTNIDEYEIKYVPSWCYINNKTTTGFTLSCYSNSSSYDRRDWLLVKARNKEVKIYINQYADYDKKRRRINGGWVNMSIGFEGGYNINGNNSWFANGIVGLRIGNYRDIVQLELGAAPGVISSYEEDLAFHLPLYGALKLSARSGKFYLKLGGAYNVIRDKYYEGDYSLRAGFGSAWKHFEWDWVYVQFNAPSEYWCDYSNIFDTSNMIIGMRMAWYITR